MVYEYLTVSDTDESVLHLNEKLKVELKNDNVQSLSTRWDETVVAMQKQADEFLELPQSEQLKPLLSLYMQDTVQKGEM